jgi:hypothetical protein
MSSAEQESPQGDAVTITFQSAGKPSQTIGCELLVVACDPRNLSKVMGLTPAEQTIFGAITNFTFHITLVKVRGAGGGPLNAKFGAILAPDIVLKMEGDVCGFRNETAKQYTLYDANQLKENHVTVYQLRDDRKGPLKPKQFEERLMRQLPQQDWWPYGKNFDLEKDAVLNTVYFDHFTSAGLVKKFPWELLKIQGRNATAYVHASTCFESVLQCWQYQQLLLSTDNPKRLVLPSAKNASIVIIGAGVSGLLFANRLRDLGYTNVRLLEQSPTHVGGKTHSVVRDQPRPPGQNEPTICELGTCYMSPAYEDLVEYLRPFRTGNARRGFMVAPGDPGNFRGMATSGAIYQKFGPVVAYQDYIILRAQEAMGRTLSLNEIERLATEAEMGAALVKYAVIHEEIMGSQRPMPLTPPEEFLRDHGQKTYLEFINYHELQALVGILEYVYSIQGYGPLSSIPAYYGLVWITSELALRMIEKVAEERPIVTFWSEGWGDVWKQMKASMTIETGVTITKISRGGAPAG